MITTRQEPQPVCVAYLTNLGYLFCAACHHDGLGAGAERGLGLPDEICDGCHQPFGASAEMEMVTVVIEHTPAKIF